MMTKSSDQGKKEQIEIYHLSVSVKLSAIVSPHLNFRIRVRLDEFHLENAIKMSVTINK